MSLRNKTGSVITVADKRWEEMLSLARRHGWSPMGTAPDIETLRKRFRHPDGGYDENEVNKAIESWEGSYSFGEGIVTYADSLSLSFALEDAAAHGFRGLDGFIGFCRKGGFTIT